MPVLLAVREEGDVSVQRARMGNEPISARLCTLLF